MDNDFELARSDFFSKFQAQINHCRENLQPGQDQLVKQAEFFSACMALVHFITEKTVKLEHELSLIKRGNKYCNETKREEESWQSREQKEKMPF